MNNEHPLQSEKIGEMVERRTTMPDGRYLIYFDFKETEPADEDENSEQLATEASDV